MISNGLKIVHCFSKLISSFNYEDISINLPGEAKLKREIRINNKEVKEIKTQLIIVFLVIDKIHIPMQHYFRNIHSVMDCRGKEEKGAQSISLPKETNDVVIIYIFYKTKQLT